MQTELPVVLMKNAGYDVDGAEILIFGHPCGGTLALLKYALLEKESSNPIHCLRIYITLYTLILAIIVIINS